MPPVDVVIDDVLIAIGAALMVVNIRRYLQFMGRSRNILEEDSHLMLWRNAGLCLLVFFLIGYVVSIFYTSSGIVLALVLFFGSVYVFAALSLMMKLVDTSQRMMSSAVDEAREVDAKTGLLNSKGFASAARHYLQKHPDKGFLLVRWDIDQFKLVNEIYGYDRGDQVLAIIGSACKDAIKTARVNGYLSADHFVALIPDDAVAVKKTAQEISGMLAGIDAPLHLYMSMGVYRLDGPDEDITQACDYALLALHAAKTDSSSVAWYDPAMSADLLERQRLREQMEPALESGQFEVWYQPQIDYAAGEVVGAEALVRWRDPERGIVPSMKFIPLFEENGFITRLDEYVWDQACRAMRSWIDEGNDPMPLSVNISRRDILARNLYEEFTGLVARYGLDPSLLHLEITETLFISDPEDMNRLVERLQAAGFHVELDDFGSGYSSLNTLKDMMVDTIKLDMKFLQGGRNENRRSRILSAVVRMADTLGISTIAEGVETREQADFLESLGCHKLQGYYFAKPMPESDYRRMLRAHVLRAEDIPSA